MNPKENHILPIVRLQKIELENFKSVRSGTVELQYGRNTSTNDITPDILGVYGQNGSGKTAVIEALAILKRVMSGEALSGRYAECITAEEDFAKLSFTFNFSYPATNAPFSRTVIYSFKLNKVEKKAPDSSAIDEERTWPYMPRIFEETICASGLFNGTMQKKQEILSSHQEGFPIGPVRKLSSFIGSYKDKLFLELAVNQRTAYNGSRSFLFSKETFELFNKYSNYSEYFQILIELQWYAQYYLYTIDTRDGGLFQRGLIPINTRQGALVVFTRGATRMRDEVFQGLKRTIDQVNAILPALIPQMKLVLHHNSFTVKNQLYAEAELFSLRGDVIIPLRSESDGVIKLIGVLSLFADAFNDQSITIAIDEFDAGIYEYLLGELLSSFEMYGKGQLIFTSHNLRPLEVLRKEDIVFTTTNPNNRYIHLKGVGRTNNLRDLYLREILSGSQDEELYKAAKRQRMIASLMKGGTNDEEK